MTTKTRNNALTDVQGVAVGHASDLDLMTGLTVILAAEHV